MSHPPAIPARVPVPGMYTRATPMTEQAVVELVLSRPEPVVRLGNLNLHGVHLYLTDAAFRTYTDAAQVVLADGWPVWRALNHADPTLDRSHRVGSSDWLFALLERDPELTVVAVGADAESSRLAAERVRERAPRVRWVAYDGYDLTQRDGGAPVSLTEILPQADLVIAGMGMGPQERWIEEHQPLMTHGVIANVGGCIDYLSGRQAHAPRWVGRAGLEWAYRLAADPRRNARRVFIEPAQLGLSLLRERRRVRRSGTERAGTRRGQSS